MQRVSHYLFPLFLSQLKPDHILDMLRMGEHIHRLDRLHVILLMKQSQVTRLSGRIAAHIDYPLGSGIKYHLHHILMHTRTRRVHYHHIRTSMLGNEFGSEHILHVSGIELGVLQFIDTGVYLGVLYCLRHILNPHHMAASTSKEKSYRTGPRIEVIHQLVTLKLCNSLATLYRR